MTDILQQILHHRGVDVPCNRCQGLGVVTYGSTSTWHGGMGGASMTKDVCDRCWGSGDENEHFVDLRHLQATEDHRVTERAADLFSQRCGVGIKSIRPGLLELVGELEKFGRGRKVRANGFDVICSCLAKLLKELSDT